MMVAKSSWRGATQAHHKGGLQDRPCGPSFSSARTSLATCFFLRICATALTVALRTYSRIRRCKCPHRTSMSAAFHANRFPGAAALRRQSLLKLRRSHITKEIKSGRHDALMLKNVMGCYSRSVTVDVRVRRVIEIIEEDLRSATQDIHFLCISPNLSLHNFGEFCHRPRVIFRLLRKLSALVSSERDFVQRVHEVAAMRYLEVHCLADIDLDVEVTEVAATTCPCVQAIHAESPKCTTHKCFCKRCAKHLQQPCAWRGEHASQWLKYGKFHTGSYIAGSIARQLPVQGTFRAQGSSTCRKLPLVMCRASARTSGRPMPCTNPPRISASGV
jgi:hypothetical protein